MEINCSKILTSIIQQIFLLICFPALYHEVSTHQLSPCVVAAHFNDTLDLVCKVKKHNLDLTYPTCSYERMRWKFRSGATSVDLDQSPQVSIWETNQRWSSEEAGEDVEYASLLRVHTLTEAEAGGYVCLIKCKPAVGSPALMWQGHANVGIATYGSRMGSKAGTSI